MSDTKALDELIEELQKVSAFLSVGAKGSLSVTKKATLAMLAADVIPTEIMCKEYGDDEDWIGQSHEDVKDGTLFDDDYQTFEIWLP